MELQVLMSVTCTQKNCQNEYKYLNKFHFKLIVSTLLCSAGYRAIKFSDGIYQISCTNKSTTLTRDRAIAFYFGKYVNNRSNMKKKTLVQPPACSLALEIRIEIDVIWFNSAFRYDKSNIFVGRCKHFPIFRDMLFFPLLEYKV